MQPAALYNRYVADGDDFSWRSSLAWLTTVVVLATGVALVFDWAWSASDGIRLSYVLLAVPGAILSVFANARRPLARLLVIVVAVSAAYLLVAVVNEVRDLQQLPGYVFHAVWASAAWIGGVVAMGVGRSLPRRDGVTPPR
ncbi:hypothetical protein GCM10010399_88260 [Dactylosporangium fulvum]|uniref:Integral membrane protein n=1 Tax=Dactylosporangium fulvum TaxID=53359 RepID=A0ABY5W623_9ACTN|nr:hypothetical protein [Dactylosporangium fulvum]UWP85435.1 hypothetical protein Dfulv_14825 [Dactylosporangium fulvum]